MSDDGQPGSAPPQNGAVSLEGFRAELEVFSGPLDLLLHLIRQDEVDILEVELSRITDRYLAAIRTMELLDINVAGDFLVVAATLMEIKSRTLLPPGEAEDDEQQDDPGAELVRRLLEYKEIKEAAGELEDRGRLQQERFARPRPPVAEEDGTQAGPETLLEDLAVWDLMAAFAEVMQQTQFKRPAHVVRGDVPVAVYVEEALRFLHASGGRARFIDLFADVCTRDRIIGMFLAVLELVRRKEVRVEQPTSQARSIVIALA